MKVKKLMEALKECSDDSNVLFQVDKGPLLDVYSIMNYGCLDEVVIHLVVSEGEWE